ncbi:MAG TPA: hypothetical protein GXX39_01465 [Syntrophothermus lipocalidus]|uniref:Heat shock protein DnaJ domain protein n=1 Tax=Syntrophothermus lipocalidus (strain DSM 12680 / TGB-C1) TaxID=643648 RepID=D7CN46_SYNLT|nr:B-box zinc finger protein [Syntrophothermus lipocalidus]ADI02131.1 heat shock protein DnaJ domain protein [Syntrophothermus lipocalidus DSM 12680]HHV76027.1 hypothetical protein [Syntrophothermus lipocalidus]HOV43561.1 hypothetical protein [Syntrophothermus lipocalidus]
MKRRSQSVNSIDLMAGMLLICDQHPQRQALRKCLMCGVLMCSECMAFGLQFGLIMCEDCVGRLLVLSWS